MTDDIKPIWFEWPTLERLAEVHQNTLVAHLGIEFIGVGPNWLSARMPADTRTVQPYGVVHGGASVVLAETLGSCGAVWSVDPAQYRAMGQEVNANHLRPVKEGWVTGTARPIHLGRRSQVWGIELQDEAGRMTAISRLTVAVVEIN